MIATESGQAKTYSLLNLSERGIMFVEPRDKVCMEQIVGENSRDNDLGVNVVKGKASRTSASPTRKRPWCSRPHGCTSLGP